MQTNQNDRTNEELVALIQAGDNVSDNMLELWKQCEKFVRSISAKYGRAAEKDDLMQSGFIGLYNAALNYEPDKGMKFISYCTLWIGSEMSQFVDKANGVHIPEYMRISARRYKKTVEKYIQEYGCEPSEREISGLMGISLEDVRGVKEAIQTGQIQSLEEPLRNGEGDTCLKECIASPENLEEDTIKAIDEEEMRRELWLAVDDLPQEESVVIQKRYLDNMTLAAAGACIGVSKSRVVTLERRALKALRENHKAICRCYYEEYLSAAPVHHIGLQSFKTTWWSETERLAIK